MIVGVDLGSRFIKFAFFDGEKLIDKRLFDSTSFYREYGEREDKMFFVDIKKIFPTEDIEIIISTGYGKSNINIADSKTIPEIKAHVLGAINQLNLSDFILLDIGGQDTKVVNVKNKKIVDFILNDKCAACSGRFLEYMAKILNVNMDELFLYYKEPIELSSTCAIYLETELIGKIAEGAKVENLISGINWSLFNRILPLIKKFEKKDIVFVGGVAQNKALVNIIKNELNVNVFIPKEPLFNAAIGCCFYGAKLCKIK